MPLLRQNAAACGAGFAPGASLLHPTSTAHGIVGIVRSCPYLQQNCLREIEDM